MVIRDLAWEDFAAITENYFALYDEVRENPDLGIVLFPERPSVGAEAEWFAALYRRVQDRTSVALVGEENGRAVALCIVDRKGPHQELRHVGVLGIMVARPWRGRGIGKELLQEIIGRSRGRFVSLELSVFASNAHARALYRSVGFRPWGLQPKGVLREGRFTVLEHLALELEPLAPGWSRTRDLARSRSQPRPNADRLAPP